MRILCGMKRVQLLCPVCQSPQVAAALVDERVITCACVDCAIEFTIHLMGGYGDPPTLRPSRERRHVDDAHTYDFGPIDPRL